MSGSLLDEADEIEVKASGGATDAAGEVKKRRGRPPGSKNKPKGGDDSLAINLESAIRGIFGLLSVILGWFGYEQTEDLTDDECKKGAAAFVPIAGKIPVVAKIAIYIGAPVWFLTMMRKKFARKGPRNEGENGSRTPGNSNVASLPLAREGTQTGNDPS